MRAVQSALQGGLVSLAVLFLSGCGTNSGPPLSLSQLPLPPGLHPYEGAYEVPLDTLTAALQGAFGFDLSRAETQYVWMPEATTWEQVVEFYHTALANTAWTPDERVGDFSQLARWTRPSSAGRQVLVLSALPLVPGPGHVLLVLLVTGQG